MGESLWLSIKSSQVIFLLLALLRITTCVQFTSSNSVPPTLVPWEKSQDPLKLFLHITNTQFLETKARVSEFKSNILLGLIWLLRGLTYKGKLGIELTCYYRDSYTQTMTLPIILTSSMCVGETWALSRVNQSRAEKYISFLPIPFLILMSGISRSVH